MDGVVLITYVLLILVADRFRMRRPLPFNKKIKEKVEQYVKLLVPSILFWTIAMVSYAVFRFYGIDEYIEIDLNPGFKKNTLFVQGLVILCYMGFGLGILYATIDFLFDRYVSKRMALGISLLFRTSIYFLVTISFFTGALGVLSLFFELNINLKYGWWLWDKRFWALIFYIVLSSFVFSFLKIATERFGKGVFVKVLLGKYKNPREEERIFMFLDLKDSTSIAEKIGHLTYSQFLQDCFYDLNSVVPKYNAEIYQYVGDEAVLSWPYRRGLANNNCIALFYAFEEQKLSRREYYMEKYGIFPKFKAGLHGGRLMAAEVGFVKKELAYHGDVINTSARIQAECNKHNVDLILSEELLKDLRIEHFTASRSLGNVLLKGKRKKIGIYTLMPYD
ncbi:MAG: adenylate/guanylate cyclase domain-containing protein [Bacteroidota bacterium]